MSATVLLVIALIVIIMGILPFYGYSLQWGYGPSGLLTIIVILILILVLTGRV